jgi:hypothetical protein
VIAQKLRASQPALYQRLKQQAGAVVARKPR